MAIKGLKFKNPPIVELVCTIQFDFETLNFAIANEFYNLVKESFPIVEEKIPIANLLNNKEQALVRYWFNSPKRDKLLQLQKGKFCFNWRKLDDENNIYPHFENVFEEFSSYWEKLNDIF